LTSYFPSSPPHLPAAEKIDSININDIIDVFDDDVEADGRTGFLIMIVYNRERDLGSASANNEHLTVEAKTEEEAFKWMAALTGSRDYDERTENSENSVEHWERFETLSGAPLARTLFFHLCVLDALSFTSLDSHSFCISFLLHASFWIRMQQFIFLTLT
jgi:hypothetical protein